MGQSEASQGLPPACFSRTCSITSSGRPHRPTEMENSRCGAWNAQGLWHLLHWSPLEEGFDNSVSPGPRLSCPALLAASKGDVISQCLQDLPPVCSQPHFILTDSLPWPHTKITWKLSKALTFVPDWDFNDLGWTSPRWQNMKLKLTSTVCIQRAAGNTITNMGLDVPLELCHFWGDLSLW